MNFPRDDLIAFLKNEFSLSALRLEAPSSAVFLRSEWPVVREKRIFTFYRALLALALLGWILIDISYEFRNIGNDMNHIRLWFTYATNWALILYLISLIALAITVAYYNLNSDCDLSNHFSGYKLLWLIYTTSSTSVATTDVIFWAFLANSGFLAFSSTMTKAKHGLTLVLVFLDLFISCIPIRLVHFLFSALLGIIYLVFTVIIWKLQIIGPDGTGVIYPRIDWGHPRVAFPLCMLAFLTMLITHIVLFATHLVRSGLTCLMKGKRFLEFVMEEAEQQSMCGEKLLLRENEATSSAVSRGGTVTTTMIRSNKHRSQYDQLE
ncbi:hypothetical protein Ciccas_003150 [Cichlidogyrus casuarinus]|uniref:Protein rolling stone n=1 Tax=Cichlidogyrus casuarinus TaxID=1844966 RepID=A0ABD2QII0_9PLAT